MKIRNFAYGPLVVVSLFVAGSAHSAEMATGERIHAIVSGMTVHGSMLTGTSEFFTEYYTEDGIIIGEGYTAKWTIENDMMCAEYGGTSVGCWEASIEGPAAIWWQDGEVQGVTISRPGNVNGF